MGRYHNKLGRRSSCRTEKVTEVAKMLISEIVPWFRLPKGLQSYNDPSFKKIITQRVSKALAVQCHLHCAWRPQLLGKVEKNNDILKRHIKKLS